MTTEIYGGSRRVSSCAACRARIEFADTVKAGRTLKFNYPIQPIDTRVDANGRLIQVVDIGQQHQHAPRDWSPYAR